MWQKSAGHRWWKKKSFLHAECAPKSFTTKASDCGCKNCWPVALKIDHVWLTWNENSVVDTQRNKAPAETQCLSCQLPQVKVGCRNVCRKQQSSKASPASRRQRASYLKVRPPLRRWILFQCPRENRLSWRSHLLRRSQPTDCASTRGIEW